MVSDNSAATMSALTSAMPAEPPTSASSGAGCRSTSITHSFTEPALCGLFFVCADHRRNLAFGY